MHTISQQFTDMDPSSDQRVNSQTSLGEARQTHEETQKNLKSQRALSQTLAKGLRKTQKTKKT